MYMPSILLPYIPGNHSLLLSTFIYTRVPNCHPMLILFSLTLYNNNPACLSHPYCDGNGIARQLMTGAVVTIVYWEHGICERLASHVQR